MYRYKQIEYRCGAVLEVIRCIPRGSRKGVPRSREEGTKSKEEMDRANMMQAARKLERKINANFKPGDLHVILTYRREARPEKAEAQKIVKKFLADLRGRYKKAGVPLKYILVTEYKRTAIHHHLIINAVNDGRKTTMDYIRKAWKGRGSPKFVQLYDNREYSNLAEYLIQETENTFREEDSPTKQRYSCSRNLVDPKPCSRIRKTKTGWSLEPRPRKGYYLIPDKLYNGFDRMGYPYQRYLMVRLDLEEDWEPEKPGGGTICMRS